VRDMFESGKMICYITKIELQKLHIKKFKIYTSVRLNYIRAKNC